MSKKSALNQPDTQDPSAAATASILDQFFPRPRSFSVRLWDGTGLYPSSDTWLVLNHPAALRRMLTPPIELSLGEAFIHGDYDIEGDIFTIFPAMNAFADRSFSPLELVALANRVRALPRPSFGEEQSRGPARLRGRIHSLQRDRAAIQYHYDVGNEFYALWLDRNMQYSCAYFDSGEEDLDTAQERKLDYLCRKLRLKKGESLLDIGCGWGGLALYAAQHYGAQVLGITLSEEQFAYANLLVSRLGLGGQVSVQLRDYRDLGEEIFDKVISVGMFEHVGYKQLPEYFACALQHLKEGGLFLNHGISRRAAVPTQKYEKVSRSASQAVRPTRQSAWQKFIDRSILGLGSFTQRYVFPDGELIPVSQVNTVAEEAGFEVRDVENLREHYALTLVHWVMRLEANKAEAIALVGEPTYRVWRLYMAASANGFSSARINVNQTLLAKPDKGRSGLPMTRADLYR